MEKVLDPQSVCEQFHLCTQVLSYQKQREESLNRIQDAVGWKPSTHNHTKRTVDKKVNAKFHQKSWKRHSGQITFVQISDIHLDREYAEVCVYPTA